MTSEKPANESNAGTGPRTVDRRSFIRSLTLGGAAALAAGTILAPRDTRACPADERPGAAEGHGPMAAGGTPVDIGELKSVKVTCLSEVGWWSTAQFLGEIDAAGGMSTSQWVIPFSPKNAGGYSAFLEAEALDGTVHTVLLDTGWNVEYMEWVFKREGIADRLKARAVERAILSHEHLDHYWGLPALCELDRKIPLYVPSTFTGQGRDFLAKSKHAGPVTQVAPGTVFRHFPGFATAVMDLPIILGVHGEQILFFNVKDKGLVMVSGCGHPGIHNMIAFAKANIATGTGKLHGLFGGLHISALEKWSPVADQMLDAMQQAQFDVVASNHCTGIMAVEKMLERKFPVAMGTASFGSKSNRYIGNGDVVVF